MEDQLNLPLRISVLVNRGMKNDRFLRISKSGNSVNGFKIFLLPHIRSKLATKKKVMESLLSLTEN